MRIYVLLSESFEASRQPRSIDCRFLRQQICFRSRRTAQKDVWSRYDHRTVRTCMIYSALTSYARWVISNIYTHSVPDDVV